jgi:hypothetical protein
MKIGTTITLIYVIIATICFISYIGIEMNEQNLENCDTQCSISSWFISSLIMAIVLYGSTFNEFEMAMAPEEVAPVFIIACITLSCSSCFVHFA